MHNEGGDTERVKRQGTAGWVQGLDTSGVKILRDQQVGRSELEREQREEFIKFRRRRDSSHWQRQVLRYNSEDG